MKKMIVGVAALAAGLSMAGDYPYQAVEMTNVSIRAGFWLPRFDTNRIVTVKTDFRKSEETGRIANFERAGKREGKGFAGVAYNDSDVYKIIEGAAYTLATHPDPELEKYLDNLISHIAKAQEEDGYLYTARTLGHADGMTGPKRWSNITHGHELYNVGHMYEAAVAYYRVTGKRSLLDVAIKSADLVDRTFGFGEGQIKAPPGHEEIELALCKLYRATGEERYLKLAKTFLDLRGRRDVRGIWGAALQDHLPVVQQTEALGHAVRAGYLYCGMADVAALTGDSSYVKAIDAIWENVVSKKLHLNGGIGARRHARYTKPPYGDAHEAFGENYDLPNEEAYLETCAAIANALWNQRMFLMYGDAKYIDVMERTVYNGFLSGISLGGDEFFYPNPLASKGRYKRSKWFGCSCCPVNVVRFIPQIAQLAYATRGNEAYVNLFVASEVNLPVAGGVTLTQDTEYPWKGLSRITVTPSKNGEKFALKVRVPGWCVGRPVPSDLYTQTVPGTLADYTVKLNGNKIDFTPEKGYCTIERKWEAGDVVEVVMNMPVRRIKAHDAVVQDRGRLAVECGPIVYCAEGVDNGGKVLGAVIASDAVFTPDVCNILGNEYPAFTVPSKLVQSGLTHHFTKDITLKLIPYFAWCHREMGEMQTWFSVSEENAVASASLGIEASHYNRADGLDGVFDGVLPRASNDHSIPRMTFWSHLGTKEWVDCDFGVEEKIKGVEVYWFDDEPSGRCRVPETWSVKYRTSKDAPWQEIGISGPVAKDKFCTIDFPAPIKARYMRLDVELKKGFSGGVLEWRFKR